MRSLLAPPYSPVRTTYKSITAASPECSLIDALRINQGGTAGTTVWPAANRALFIPFEMDSPHLITKLAWYNGTTVGENVDIGIYDTGGNLIVSAGATAQSGTVVIQTVDITDTLLKAGVYYCGMVKDSTAHGVIAFTPSTLLLRMVGVQEMASAYPLPSTATYANPTSAYVPWVSVGYGGVF